MNLRLKLAYQNDLETLLQIETMLSKYIKNVLYGNTISVFSVDFLCADPLQYLYTSFLYNTEPNNTVRGHTGR